MNETATAAQQVRLNAIQKAVALLDGAGVSFTFFASPDYPPSPEMKVFHAQKLSYAKDLDDILKESLAARKEIQYKALSVFSIGMKGSIVLVAEDGKTPVCGFKKGHAVGLEKAKAKSEPEGSPVATD